MYCIDIQVTGQAILALLDSLFLAETPSYFARRRRQPLPTMARWSDGALNT
jgi:hypothetical protein